MAFFRGNRCPACRMGYSHTIKEVGDTCGDYSRTLKSEDACRGIIVAEFLPCICGDTKSQFPTCQVHRTITRFKQ